MTFQLPFAENNLTGRLVRAIQCAIGDIYERIPSYLDSLPLFPAPERDLFGVIVKGVNRPERRIQMIPLVDFIFGLDFSHSREQFAELLSGIEKQQKPRPVDRHLKSDGQNPRASLNKKSEPHLVTRIEGLVKNAVADALRESAANAETQAYFGKTHRVCVPSAFKIALDYLTIPAEPSSRAYAFYAVRASLVRCCGDHNVPRDVKCVPDFPEVVKSIRYIRGQHRQAKTVGHTQEPETYFLYHFLAMTGYLTARINFSTTDDEDTDAEPAESTSEDTTQLKATFARVAHLLKTAPIIPREGTWKPEKVHGLSERVVKRKAARQTLQKGRFDIRVAKFEFKTSMFANRAPDPSTIVNQVKGIPIPIRGADFIFSGGLYAPGNLIVGVQGRAGSGKTSLALSIAAGLAPMGVRTVYVSIEEQDDQLRARLNSVTPAYLRNLSFAPNFEDVSDWFSNIYFPGSAPLIGSDANPVATAEQRLTELSALVGALEAKVRNWKRSGPGEEAPLLVVLDTVHAYFTHQAGRQESAVYFSRLIELCKGFEAIVMIVGSPDEGVVQAIDGLSSISIDLHHENTNSLADKPFRVFELRKTRHQPSRVGSHLFHISGEKGFRISPQLGSQVDRGSERVAQLPSADKENIYFDVLERPSSREIMDAHGILRPAQPKRWMRFYPDSQILLHGFGSTGKAGLGLKLLLAPPLLDTPLGKTVIHGSLRPRVLVLSFLYQENYYRHLLGKLDPLIRTYYQDVANIEDFTRFISPNIVEVIHLHPGNLRPEDLYSKLCDRLERARLQGVPYSGILIDGLHNLFLAFPSLQGASLIWPALYAHLRTLPGLTTVTTHTAISVDQESHRQEYYLERDKPFLIALVQACDFYLEVHSALENGEVAHQEEATRGPLADISTIKVRTAIGQAIPQNVMHWSRSNLTVHVP